MHQASPQLYSQLDPNAHSGAGPNELVYGAKPDLADLCAFGTPCAIIRPGAKLRKLDDHAVMWVFIGYKYGGGGYWVWDPHAGKVVESRDVTFFKEGCHHPLSARQPCQPMTQRTTHPSNKLMLLSMFPFPFLCWRPQMDSNVSSLGCPVMVCQPWHLKYLAYIHL